MTRFTLALGRWREGHWTGDNGLRCPVCGGDYGHVKRVVTEIDPKGDENTVAPYSGTAIVEFPNGSRRPAVRIDIEGECGHDWSLLIQQDKGTLLVQARAGDDP